MSKAIQGIKLCTKPDRKATLRSRPHLPSRKASTIHRMMLSTNIPPISSPNSTSVPPSSPMLHLYCMNRQVPDNLARTSPWPWPAANHYSCSSRPQRPRSPPSQPHTEAGVARTARAPRTRRGSSRTAPCRGSCSAGRRSRRERGGGSRLLGGRRGR